MGERVKPEFLYALGSQRKQTPRQHPRPVHRDMSPGAGVTGTSRRRAAHARLDASDFGLGTGPGRPFHAA